MKRLAPFIASIVIALAMSSSIAFADEAVADVPEPASGLEQAAPTAFSAPVEAAPESAVTLAPQEAPDMQIVSTPAQTEEALVTLAPESSSEDNLAHGTDAGEPIDPSEETLDTTLETGQDSGQDSQPAESDGKVVEGENAEQPQPTVRTLAVAPTVLKAKISVAAPAKVDSDRTEANGYYLVDKTVYQISSALGKLGALALDVYGASSASGANVIIYAGKTSTNQMWQALYQGAGIYRFKSLVGGHYLGVVSAPKSTVNVAVNNGAYIDWKLTKLSNGSFNLTPASNSKLFLSVEGAKASSGTNVRLWSTNANNGQRFWFSESKPLTVAIAGNSRIDLSIVEIAFAANQAVRVDIAGASNADSGNVLSGKDSASRSQLFTLIHKGSGLYEIQNFNSGKLLDVAKASTASGANLIQYKRNNGLNQLWYFVESGNGYLVKSVLSGKAVTAKGGKATANVNLQVENPAGNQGQVFVFKDAPLVANGTYVLQSAIAMPMVLDVNGGSKSNGANVQIYRSNGTNAQKFKITYLGRGQYRIVNIGSNRSLDVAYASKSRGANVIQYATKDSDNQKWFIELGSNGYMFKSVLSGQYLDVSGAKVKSGTNVLQWSGKNSKNQSWILRDANWSFYKGVSTRDMRYIEKAEEYEGWRYQWGGRSPSTSFDCAGLVMYCANKVWGTNFDLMYTNAEMLYYKCKAISASQARPGDLVFYRGTYGSNVNYISHVVIYAGNGWMYGAGDPIGYDRVNAITNIYGRQATALYARIYH